MEEQQNKSLSHAVYSIRLHVVFVTKYRRKVLTDKIRKYLQHQEISMLTFVRKGLINIVRLNGIIRIEEP